MSNIIQEEKRHYQCDKQNENEVTSYNSAHYEKSGKNGVKFVPLIERDARLAIPIPDILPSLLMS